MPFSFASSDTPNAIPVRFVTKDSWPEVRRGMDATVLAYADACGFEPKAGQHLLLPGPDGLAGVLFAHDDARKKDRDRFIAGRLAGVLPAGMYTFEGAGEDLRMATLAFAMGCYSFTRYGKPRSKELKLALPADMDTEDLSRIIEAVTLARDLINTPTNDMGPSHLEEAVRAVGEKFGAKVTSVVGDELLRERLTLIHAVGRSATNAPRLIDLTWGDPKHPKVTLVGKGVCFDTGGLDIKPDSGMLNMKKDMGGAASMLALAHMLMSRKARIRASGILANS